MLWKLTWQGQPDPTCIVSGELVTLELVRSEGFTHVGHFETELEGAMHCRHAQDPPPLGQWGHLIAVPEPTVGLSAILLFGVMLWRRRKRRD